MIYVTLIMGCLLLFKGGDWLLDGMIGIGRRLKLSTAIIGLVLVSLGTSAPELFVSLGSAIQGHGAMAAGNVVGSNILNIAIVLGIILCVVALRVEQILFHQLLVVVALSLLVLWSIRDGQVTRLEGFGLVIIMIASLVMAIKSGNSPQVDEYDLQNVPVASIKKSAALTIGGIATLMIGAESLIWGALSLAEKFNLSEAVVALTVTAFGTSLPEIAASIVAVLRRETTLALGNVVGSNLLNIGLVLGVSATIVPLNQIELDGLTMVYFIGLVLVVLAFSIWRKQLPRWIGFGFLASYCAYVTLLLQL